MANITAKSSSGLENLAGQKPASDGGSLILLGLAFVFTGLAFVQLDLVNRELDLLTFLPLLVLVGCSSVTVYLLQRRPDWRRAGDPILLPLVFFLSGLGLVLVARLAPAFLLRQLFWLLVATTLLLLIVLIPKNLDWLRRYKYTWLIGGLILLGGTLVFGVNPSGFGARLWLQLVGTLYFQPSELLKLLLLVFLAAYLADRRRQLIEVQAYIGRVPFPHLSYLGPMLLMWGFSMVLLIWQRDLGAALLFFGTFLGMVYLATGQTRYLWAGVLLLVIGANIGYLLFDVVRLRVEGFLNPWLDPSGRSFQIVQSLLAFASGGIFGQGLGQGLPTAIPVVHTDFVYAAIGEEYGLIGALGVLVCFALLISRAFSIATQARTEFEQLLAAGIGTMLGLQTIVITAGTLKLMPLTGVTLPFVSYGGSSLLVSFFMVALLLFISKDPAGRPLRSPAGAPQQRAYPHPFPPLRPQTLRLARALLTGMLIVAGGLLLWQVALAPFLVNRPDNPRPIIEQQKIDRGRLLTRQGVPLAETLIDEAGLAQRHYPYPELSSVTGYYSIRHGVSGAEAAFDSILSGIVTQSREDEILDDLLHRPLIGQDVTLTVDLPAQVAADVALDDQEGAVVVMEIETGAILVMSSHPTYDPNTLDEQWDSLRTDRRAPLLNRATQGLFPVGDLARLVGLIGLHEAGVIVPSEPLTTPLDELVEPLGPVGYLATAQQLQLTRPFAQIRSQPGRLPQFEARGTVRDLAVTPLHLARVVAALALEGQLPDPSLSLQEEPAQEYSFSPETARQVRAWLPQVGEQLVGLSGQATPEETGQASLSWFVGLAPASAVQPQEPQPSAALAGGELILDPTKITAATPTLAAALPEMDQPRYVVVAVVVTDKPEANPALRVARAPLRVLLEGE